MSDQNPLDRPNTTDLGWRIQQLRIRRGLQQKTLARLANVDAAFLNRMERGRSSHSRPKPETIHRLLDALDATSAEREAVFHVEVPPLSDEEIQSCVAEIKSTYEHAHEPMVLVDGRWNRWYINEVGRRMFALSDDEYRRCLGRTTLDAFVDPEQPLYSRYSDEHREFQFAERLIIFKTYFTAQQFDTWYLAIEDYVKRFPLGRRVWEHPESYVPPTFMFSQEVTMTDPAGRIYRLAAQADILLKTPRFMLVQLRPRDGETQRLLSELHTTES
ncbi:MAG TPA: helix-turn-helix domain-containing protein [Chloroflexia bacterium]|nr:helix-turn-helix domain-containing protein [Chloroflexia bacterium]